MVVWLLAVALAGDAPKASPAPAATAQVWPSWRGDGAQLGAAPGKLALPLDRRWSFAAGEAIVSSAVVDAARVYVGVKDGRVLALDRKTGALSWSVTTGGPVEAPPLVAGDAVVVGSRDGKVRALDAATGAVRWTFEAAAEVVGAATWVGPRDGRGPSVLVGAYDGRLHRLDLATGASLWTYATGSYLYGSAAVRGDQAVIGGCDGFIHTVRLADGVGAARTEIASYVGASVAWPADGEAYVGHFGNRVVGFDPGRGTVAWTHFDRNFPYLSSPAVTSEVVILGGRDRVVRALERKTGEAWWMFPTQGKVDGSPVVVGDDVVVVGASDGRLYVLALEDGAQRQAWDAGEPIVASPAVAGGWVFFGTEGGTFLALGPREGKK